MAAVAPLGPQFRPMTASDLDVVMEVETRAYAFPWSRGIFADCIASGYACWVMEFNQTVQGHGILSKGVDEIHLLNVCVRRENQGQGYGRLFVRHLVDQAKGMGGAHLFLEVRASNRVAIALYESLGFVEVGRRKDYYPGDPEREDALVLSLDLSSWN